MVKVLPPGDAISLVIPRSRQQACDLLLARVMETNPWMRCREAVRIERERNPDLQISLVIADAVQHMEVGFRDLGAAQSGPFVYRETFEGSAPIPNFHTFLVNVIHRARQARSNGR